MCPGPRQVITRDQGTARCPDLHDVRVRDLEQEQRLTTDRIGAIEALLARTEEAHGVFETTELNGVYDQEWARWYAQYAVDHGMGAVLGRAITANELAGFLTSEWNELQRADPKPTEAWAVYTARRIAEEL